MSKIVGEIPLVGQRGEPTDDEKRQMAFNQIAALTDMYAMEAFKAIMPGIQAMVKSDQNGSGATPCARKVAAWCYRHAQQMLIDRGPAIQAILATFDKETREQATGEKETRQ